MNYNLLHRPTMFETTFVGLLLWLGLSVFELVPIITLCDMSLVCILMAFIWMHYEATRGLPDKRETAEWLKARFKAWTALAPATYYLMTLGIPLEMILIFDWCSLLQLCIKTINLDNRPYVPKRQRKLRIIWRKLATGKLLKIWSATLPMLDHLRRIGKEGLDKRQIQNRRLQLASKPTFKWKGKSRIVKWRWKGQQRRFHVSFMAYVAVSGLRNEAMTFPLQGPDRLQRFDSDSRPWLIDNCLTACISNRKEDFVGPLQRVRAEVKGIGGPMMVTMRGTLRWSIKDDQGRAHTFHIPNSYYGPKSPVRLFSPQHWAQVSPFKDNPKRNWLIGECAAGRKGTWAGTYDDGIEMHWNHNQYHRWIQLDKATNVGKIYTAPGAKRFRVFKATFDTAFSQEEPFACNANLISDDDSIADYQKAPSEGALHKALQQTSTVIPEAESSTNGTVQGHSGHHRRGRRI